MSLSFPASPTPNQVYQSWIFQNGAWQNNTQASIVTSVDGQIGAVTQPGRRRLITQTDVSTAVASVDFFAGFDGSYDELQLSILDAIPSVTDFLLSLRFSADGSTFEAGATSYSYAQVLCPVTTPTAQVVGATGAQLSISAAMWGPLASAQGYGSYITAKINREPFGAMRNAVTWQGWGVSSSSLWTGSGGGNWNNVNSPVLARGMRVLYTGGANIVRGSFRLYGIIK